MANLTPQEYVNNDYGNFNLIRAIRIDSVNSGFKNSVQFFIWIIQYFKIKRIWGLSENDVRKEIWIVISSYVIVAIATKKFKLSYSWYEVMEKISISELERIRLKNLV